MATDTARINLELASGRNEVTAPFHQTAQRRRFLLEEPPLEAEAAEVPADARVTVTVPVDDAPGTPPIQSESIAKPRLGRPTWIAFIGATMAVAAAVWWVMFQRLPDIDPREVIERNLVAARTAMAEGRYTDPPQLSAFHYYSTVLALDPDNSDAVAGIDAIADRHLTNARVLLAEQRVAEAAVAIDRARRVRPDHNSLADLDAQLRAGLKKMLTAANAAVQAAPAQTKLAKAPAVANAPVNPSLPTKKQTAAPAATSPAPESGITPLASASKASKVPPPLSLAPNLTQQTSPITPAPAAADESGSAPVIDEPTQDAAAPITAGPPTLIKMVEPEFPQAALMRGIEGWVDVSLEVNAAGDVVAPRIEDSSRGRLFNRAALSAVQQWKYEPRDGDTSERVLVRLQFRYSE